jgi:hypothetical protein
MVLLSLGDSENVIGWQSERFSLEVGMCLSDNLRYRKPSLLKTNIK